MSEQEQKKKHSITRIIIALIVIIIIILLLLKGCIKCEPKPESQPGPDAAADIEKSKPAEPVKEVKGGYVFVKSGGEMTFKVFTVTEKEKGKKEYSEVTKGNCNLDKPLLKPGEYLVRVYPKGRTVSLGMVTVENEKTVTLNVEGFGTISVGCPVFQAPYEILSNGKPVDKGNAGVSKTLMAIGTYQIKMKIAGLTIMKDVEVTSDKLSHIAITEIGKLKVNGPIFNWKYTILHDGKDVAAGAVSVNEVPLPVGKYQIKIGVAGMTIIKDAEITPAKLTQIHITEVGLLKVNGRAFNRGYSIEDKAGKQVGKGGLSVSKIPLPVGDYNVILTICGKRSVTPVTIKGGSNQDLNIGNHGILTVGSPKFNARFIVKDKDGKEIASGGTGVSKVVLPNGTYTVIYEGREKPLKVAGQEYGLNFKKEVPAPQKNAKSYQPKSVTHVVAEGHAKGDKDLWLDADENCGIINVQFKLSDGKGPWLLKFRISDIQDAESGKGVAVHLGERLLGEVTSVSRNQDYLVKLNGDLTKDCILKMSARGTDGAAIVRSSIQLMK